MYLGQNSVILTELGITDIQACKAALSDPDILTYDQVLLDPEIEEWKKSTHKEITQLESKDIWVEVPTSEATSKIHPGTWVFDCKRAPTGIITKVKARYCGDHQEDKPETYAPVVSWSTTRLVLVFTLTEKWHLICVDFNNGFVHLDTPSQRIHTQVNHSYMSQTHKKSLWSLSCAQALVTISMKRID